MKHAIRILKKHASILLLVLVVSSWTQSAFTQQTRPPQEKTHTPAAIFYDATQDFEQLHAGDAPYYIDKGNDALAINASIVEYRGLFARAATVFEGPSGQYDITITTMTEEDGESLYRLIVNGEIVGTHRGAYIGPGHAQDLKAERHTWKNISISKNASLAIESTAHTNGEIPEKGGTAWSRGRWQSLTLAQANPTIAVSANFSKHKDLLLSQFDFQPDADDVHAVAAYGAMLRHDDLKDIMRFAVAGTTGTQGGTYINARSLMKSAFGKEGHYWMDAKKGRKRAVTQVRNRVRAILAQGGSVWVQEAGQSDFTADWLKALVDAGVHESIIKNNVIVVQHSRWNEKHTTPTSLAFVKEKAIYQAVTDGNKPMKRYIRKDRRGPFTPMYKDENTKWISSATSSENGKTHAKQLWQEASKLIEKAGFDAKYSAIPKGGVDFSDNVALWWILNLGQKANSVHAFWERYVSDVQLDAIAPPNGRLAVVIDGNSPDPDDIGATPVMLALLQQADLNDRLVHISHSCDLNPFRNKGRQIDAENEARRQTVLHELIGKSITLFGPFDKLDDYHNCRTDQDAARDDLVNAINASTATDPLWIVEAGEPDLIGYALQKANPASRKHVHLISHHPANDDSGDFFTWQQILDFGITEHQIGDQNVSLQTPISDWDWAKKHENPAYQYLWEMLAYAEQDGVVPFQTNKFDCSDAGMVYWWITGADKGGNADANVNAIKTLLLHPEALK